MEMPFEPYVWYSRCRMIVCVPFPPSLRLFPPSLPPVKAYQPKLDCVFVHVIGDDSLKRILKQSHKGNNIVQLRVPREADLLSVRIWLLSSLPVSPFCYYLFVADLTHHNHTFLYTCRKTMLIDAYTILATYSLDILINVCSHWRQRRPSEDLVEVCQWNIFWRLRLFGELCFPLLCGRSIFNWIVL